MIGPGGTLTTAEARRRVEAARVVAGMVLADLRGEDDAEQVAAGLGWCRFEGWELTDAAMSLVSGLLHSLARDWGECPLAFAERWALGLAAEEASLCS